MTSRYISFVSPNVAQLLERNVSDPPAGHVLVRTAVTTVSAGTERANLVGGVLTTIQKDAGITPFPHVCGYSGAGVIEKVGEGVTEFAVGDRVYTSWGQHAELHIFPVCNVHKLPDSLSFEEGSILHICTFPLAALRKSRLEIGESAMTVGLGILGMISVLLQKAAGAYPVIASDPNPERRKIALSLGADFALDPTCENYEDEVRRLTDGRMINAATEVTGNGQALDRLLDVMAPFGRVSLLGCTRKSDFTIDYYRKVHGPGITLIGAHTLARPKVESSEHMFTEKDDIETAMRLAAAGRIPLKSLICETHSPAEATEVFTRLAENKDFPVCLQFDWCML